jgi:hypothetical protein
MSIIEFPVHELELAQYLIESLLVVVVGVIVVE